MCRKMSCKIWGKLTWKLFANKVKRNICLKTRSWNVKQGRKTSRKQKGHNIHELLEIQDKVLKDLRTLRKQSFRKSSWEKEHQIVFSFPACCLLTETQSPGSQSDGQNTKNFWSETSDNSKSPKAKIKRKFKNRIKWGKKIDNDYTKSLHRCVLEQRTMEGDKKEEPKNIQNREYRRMDECRKITDNNTRNLWKKKDENLVSETD